MTSDLCREQREQLQATCDAIIADRDRLASELQAKTEELARVRPLLEEITEDLERFESAELLAMVPRTCEAIREFTTRSRAALERKEGANP